MFSLIIRQIQAIVYIHNVQHLQYEQGQIYTFDDGLDSWGRQHIITYFNHRCIPSFGFTQLAFHCRSCKRRQREEPIRGKKILRGLHKQKQQQQKIKQQ